MKILLAADGSPFTLAAARYVRRNLGDWPGPHEIHVLHVQAPLPYAGRANAVLGTAVVERMRAADRHVALEGARQALNGSDAKLFYVATGGEVDDGIEQYASEHAIDIVVVGSHGHGSLAGAVLGSIARKVIARSSVPVLVIPRAAVEETAARRAEESTAPA